MEYLRKEWDESLTIQELSVKLGHSKSVITTWASKHGLKAKGFISQKSARKPLPLGNGGMAASLTKENNCPRVGQ